MHIAKILKVLKMPDRPREDPKNIPQSLPTSSLSPSLALYLFMLAQWLVNENCE